MAYLAIALLCTFQLAWGILPALTRLDTDFPNYYVASRLVLEGRDVSDMYDDAWFRQEIRGHGIDRDGRFTPFPPATAFVMLPLAWLPPLDALRVWTVLNVALAAAVVFLIARLTGRSLRWSALILLVTGLGLANNFRFGQLYLLIAAALLAGLLLYQRGSLTSAGLVWGLAASVKYVPAVLLVHCLVRREWRAAAAGAAAIAAVHLASGFILGFGVVERYASGVVLGHLQGDMPDPSSFSYQSWPSLLHRLFPVDGAPGGYRAGLLLIGAVSLSALGAAYARTWSWPSGRIVQAGLALACAMALLPASATYHFVLLAVPAALFAASVLPAVWARAALVCYAAIGFVPYSLFADAGTSVLPLGYPRLWLATAFFGCAVAGICALPRGETQPLTVRV